MMRLALLLLIAPLLGGCFQTGVGSVAGGECKIFERPPYVVLGKARYDQDWIDSQIEGGVGGCRWRRPAARPAELDAVAGRKVIATPKKRGLFKRIRERVIKPAWPAASAPITPTPEVPAVVVAPEPPAPPPPRSAVDELLSPNDRVRRVFP
jgi:hypothetical protein